LAAFILDFNPDRFEANNKKNVFSKTGKLFTGTSAASSEQKYDSYLLKNRKNQKKIFLKNNSIINRKSTIQVQC
jgi:hypothetical protein